MKDVILEISLYLLEKKTGQENRKNRTSFLGQNTFLVSKSAMSYRCIIP